jgi:hypothetical protein
VLAYVFWHTPAEGTVLKKYERALLAFQRSLAASPPFGFRGSAVFRIGVLPWRPRAGEPLDGGSRAGGAAAYEDWYLLDDFAALGVLNEAAVGRGHRTSHDRAARGSGGGTASVYRLIEGEIAAAQRIANCPHATWVKRGAGTKQSELGALLGDGMDRAGASLWQRQLALGPAPEFCLFSREDPPGVAPTRLAGSWSAQTLALQTLFGG